jgi:hypothetical protein
MHHGIVLKRMIQYIKTPYSAAGGPVILLVDAE